MDDEGRATQTPSTAERRSLGTSSPGRRPVNRAGETIEPIPKPLDDSGLAPDVQASEVADHDTDEQRKAPAAPLDLPYASSGFELVSACNSAREEAISKA